MVKITLSLRQFENLGLLIAINDDSDNKEPLANNFYADASYIFKLALARIAPISRSAGIAIAICLAEIGGTALRANRRRAGIAIAATDGFELCIAEFNAFFFSNHQRFFHGFAGFDFRDLFFS